MRSELAKQVLASIKEKQKAALPVLTAKGNGGSHAASKGRRQTSRNTVRLPVYLVDVLKALAERNHCSLNSAVVWAIESMLENERTIRVRIAGLKALMPKDIGSQIADAATPRVRMPEAEEYGQIALSQGCCYALMLRMTKEEELALKNLKERVGEGMFVSLQSVLIVAMVRWANNMLTLEALEAEAAARKVVQLKPAGELILEALREREAHKEKDSRMGV